MSSTIEDIKPVIRSIGKTTLILSTSFTTYNESGITYNQAGETYDGYTGVAFRQPTVISVRDDKPKNVGIIKTL